MILNILDILNFAIRIEENGEGFYRKALSSFQDESIRPLFLELAQEELRHKKYFEDLLKREDFGRVEIPSEEYFEYLKDYIDGKIIFSKEKENLISNVRNPSDVIDFAIEIEKDSILFYKETEEFVPEKYKKGIKDIIEEEKRHFQRLLERKKALQF